MPMWYSYVRTVGLVALENKFAGQGFKILAFPCNEFDHQEPKSNEDIQKYAVRVMRLGNSHRSVV